MSRWEVIFRVSIHRDSSVTGANAIASSEEGTATASAVDRTKRSRAGPAAIPGSTGFQIIAGGSVSVMATFRGPLRRSRYGASERRQVSAAC